MAISTGGTNWTEVNDRFCEIMGYSREEISQQKRTDFIHPDDVESARKDYTRLLTGESDYYTADRRYVRKDGEVLYLAVFVKVFRSKEGTVDNVLGLFDDVTERKMAQEASKP
jgi:PAS domain S-box-containing protein